MMQILSKLFWTEQLLAANLIRLMAEAHTLDGVYNAYDTLLKLLRDCYVEEENEMPEVSPEEALEAVVAEMLREMAVIIEDEKKNCEIKEVLNKTFSDSINLLDKHQGEHANAFNCYLAGSTAHKVGA